MKFEIIYDERLGVWVAVGENVIDGVKTKFRREYVTEEEALEDIRDGSEVWIYENDRL